jgi:hypothetical protein
MPQMAASSTPTQVTKLAMQLYARRVQGPYHMNKFWRCFYAADWRLNKLTYELGAPLWDRQSPYS